MVDIVTELRQRGQKDNKRHKHEGYWILDKSKKLSAYYSDRLWHSNIGGSVFARKTFLMPLQDQQQLELTLDNLMVH